MSALAGLGALAGGVATGLERGERLAQDRQTRELRQRAIDEQEKVRRDLQAADQAMADRLKEFQQQAGANADPVQQFNRLGGTDSSMPDQAAIDAAPAAQPWRPDNRQLMAAAQARTDKLFELGRHDAAVKQWAQDEGLRAQIRKRAAVEGMTAFKTSGDPRALLDGLYSAIDDDHDLADVKPITSLDPKAPPSWRVERVNRRTGERKSDVLSSDDIQGVVDFALNPEQAARYSLMEKLAGFRGEQTRQTNDAKHSNRLDEIQLQNDGRYDVAALQAASREQVAQLNFDGRIRVAELRGSGGSKGGGGSNSAGNVARTVNLADGRVLLIMRNGDQRIAADDNGNPLTSLEFEKVVGQTANTVGKSLEGLTSSPEAVRERAKGMLPKQPPAAPPRTLGDMVPPQTGAPPSPRRPSDPASRPPLAAFEKRN
jgi:hypothetical protein